MNVYFISGLAADERVFKYITLPENYRPIHLKWIKPLPPESLGEYASRLAKDIDPNEPFMLVGLSMGGMIAAEIAQLYQPEKLIIISSIPEAAQLPVYFKWAGKIKLHKIMPASVFKSASLLKRFFSVESSADKKYLRQAIMESDPAFINWAIDAILTWKGTGPVNCIHIHGSKDVLLPAKYTNPTHLVNGGGHMMVLTQADDINKILKEVFV